jgi:peroxiredoxin Q/BCP
MRRTQVRRLALALLLAAPGLARAGGLAVGDVAPDFALEGSDGEVHRLSDLRGERAVVLAWYPKAFTSGCTIECRSLAKHGDEIRSFDVAYFMASVDPLEESAAFAKSEEADFPLLSDPTKETAKAYGVLGPYGVAQRWTFYIGKDGRILAIDTQVAPATAAEDVAARLAELGVEKRR